MSEIRIRYPPGTKGPSGSESVMDISEPVGRDNQQLEHVMLQGPADIDRTGTCASPSNSTGTSYSLINSSSSKKDMTSFPKLFNDYKIHAAERTSEVDEKMSGLSSLEKPVYDLVNKLKKVTEEKKKDSLAQQKLLERVSELESKLESNSTELEKWKHTSMYLRSELLARNNLKIDLGGDFFPSGSKQENIHQNVQRDDLSEKGVVNNCTKQTESQNPSDMAETCVKHTDSVFDLLSNTEPIVGLSSRTPNQADHKSTERTENPTFAAELQLEKNKNRYLESKVALLEQQLNMKLNSQDDHPERHQNKVVSDLLAEIGVLQQQMIVAVEDFEKERVDKTKAVSSHSKLKDNFQSLVKKVKILKQQLASANASLREQTLQNNGFKQTIQVLQEELRRKNHKLSQYWYSNRLSPPQLPVHHEPMITTTPPPPPNIAAQLLQNWKVPSTSQEQPQEWACEVCTYSNSAIRSICEMCGSLQTSEPRNMLSNPTPRREFRLISRGLSTDDSLTYQFLPLDQVDGTHNTYRSNSL